MNKIAMDLGVLPAGQRYEDTYGTWLTLFREMAESRQKFIISRCPRSWASLAYALGNDIVSVRDHFPTDQIARMNPELLPHFMHEGLLREVVENHSTLRPELVDALYKADVEWNTLWRQFKEPMREDMTLVTNNASFFRQQFIYYLDHVLPRYEQKKRKCVIVPCAADKPYPAPLHIAVRAHIGSDYEIIIATGVLGLVPESLWSKMPLYDSGMPNQWRCMRVVEKFFVEHQFSHILVYSDFYASAIARGLSRIRFPGQVKYLFGDHDDMQYQELLNPDNLMRLHDAQFKETRFP